MTAYVFPGQGSQSVGMGSRLFPEFPELVAQADAILGYSIVDLCLENKGGDLNQTCYTQPALYVVNALSYLKKNQEAQREPHYLAGHSLGEYNALFAAQVFDFETGLRLVQKRAELMHAQSGGSMAAVIGLRKEAVQAILQQGDVSDLVVANDNSYTQLIISGSREAMAVAELLVEKAGASLFVPLKVSGAFHSPAMKAAQHVFSEFITQFTFAAPKIPVIANVNAKPYQSDAIQSNLIQQITCPVQWTSTIEYLLEQGELDFVEVGPGSVLTGLIRRIQKGQ